MKHKKFNHRTNQCKEFLKGACTNTDDICWYMHKPQDFQQANWDKNPPLILTNNLLIVKTNQI